MVTKGGIRFEVKWRRNAKPLRVRIGEIKNVVSLSRDGFSTDPLTIPVYLFLACFSV